MKKEIFNEASKILSEIDEYRNKKDELEKLLSYKIVDCEIKLKSSNISTIVYLRIEELYAFMANASLDFVSKKIEQLEKEFEAL